LASATPLLAYPANVGSLISMTWVCSLMMTDAMSSVWPKSSRPRPVKKAFDRLRSLTGRLTNSLVGISGSFAGERSAPGSGRGPLQSAGPGSPGY
jgi:hypothetical protein